MSAITPTQNIQQIHSLAAAVPIIQKY